MSRRSVRRGFSARDGIARRQYALVIRKELFRKTIHLCSAFVPLFLGMARVPVLCALTCAAVLYTAAEVLRLNGRNIPVVSAVTAAAARKRDENKFVLGPVTLVAGIVLAALLFEPLPAAVGIYALSFGDGLASLAGKLFGRVTIPLTGGKTAAGSLTCFAAIFVSCAIATGNTKVALCTASAGMLIEMLPLKDFDNVVIPLALGAISQIML